MIFFYFYNTIVCKTWPAMLLKFMSYNICYLGTSWDNIKINILESCIGFREQMNTRAFVLIFFFWAFLTIITPTLILLSESSKTDLDQNGKRHF